MQAASLRQAVCSGQGEPEGITIRQNEGRTDEEDGAQNASLRCQHFMEPPIVRIALFALVCYLQLVA